MHRTTKPFIDGGHLLYFKVFVTKFYYEGKYLALTTLGFLDILLLKMDWHRSSLLAQWHYFSTFNDGFAILFLIISAV